MCAGELTGEEEEAGTQLPLSLAGGSPVPARVPVRVSGILGEGLWGWGEDPAEKAGGVEAGGRMAKRAKTRPETGRREIVFLPLGGGFSIKGV